MIILLMIVSLLIPDTHLAFVRTKDFFGSGVVYKDGYVLTAEHLYHEDGIYVNHAPFEDLDGRKKAEVVDRDKDNDLMLLKADNMKGSVEFANPVIDEEVIIVGYSIGIKMVFHGRVSAIVGNRVFIDCDAMKGASGSGVFNKKGKMIGLISSQVSDGHEVVLVAIHPRAIKNFLGVK